LGNYDVARLGQRLQTRSQVRRLADNTTFARLALAHQFAHDHEAGSDAGTLLEPILAAIEGGGTTRDVRNARALLAELV
jgi:hypothetical protein